MPDNNDYADFQPDRSQPDKVVNSLIGHRIKILRQKANLGYQPLAAVLDIPVRHFKEIEAGNVGISAGQLHRLCTAFSVEASYFFAELSELEAAGRGEEIEPYIARELPRLFKAYLRMNDRALKKSFISLAESVANSGRL